MKLFECQSCGNPLYFENTKCERCHHQTGYLPDLEVVSAVEPEGDKWVALADRSKLYRFCANWELHACNWMVEADSSTPLCRACQHNRTIPDISDPARFAQLQYIHDLIHAKLPKRADAPAPPPASSQDASEQALRPALLRQTLSAVTRRLLGGGDRDGANA